MKIENAQNPIQTVPIPPKDKDKKMPKVIVSVPPDTEGKKAILGDEKK